MSARSQLLAVVTAALWGAPALAERAPPTLGTVGALSGKVELKREHADWAPLSFGERLVTGDRVRAGKLGYARVDFPSGGGVRVHESTSLLVEGTPDAPVLVLEEGTARAFSERPAGEARPRLSFRTPDGAKASVRGTQAETALQVRARRTEKGLELALVAGEGVLEAAGNERPLAAGQYSDLLAGEPSAPRSLPAPPQALRPNPDARFLCNGLWVRLQWTAVPGASGYLLQAAKDPSFQSLVVSATQAELAAVFAPREVGWYVWRVATVDADGRPGDFGEARALFCEKGEPKDYLLRPELGEDFKVRDAKARVSFSWQPAPGTSAYRVVVSRSSDLRSPVMSRPAQGPTLDVDDLPDGKYFWGAYIDDALPYPLFLMPRTFSLKRLPSAKVKTTKVLKEWGR